MGLGVLKVLSSQGSYNYWLLLVAFLTLLTAFFQFFFISLMISPYAWFYPIVWWDVSIFSVLGAFFGFKRFKITSYSLFLSAALLSLFPLVGRNVSEIFGVAIPFLTLVLTFAALKDYKLTNFYLLLVALLLVYFSNFLLSGFIHYFHIAFILEQDFIVLEDVLPEREMLLVSLGVAILPVTSLILTRRKLKL